LLGILIFKVLIARRLYKSFSVKWLNRLRFSRRFQTGFQIQLAQIVAEWPDLRRHLPDAERRTGFIQLE
jgi:hypothetical protein